MRVRIGDALLRTVWAVAILFTHTASACADEAGTPPIQACLACHRVGPEGPDLGPSLVGVMGRKAGSLPDYRYSGAMRRSDLVWDAATLSRFLIDPQATVPGNRMPFSGVSAQDAQAIVKYLESLSAKSSP